MNCEAFDQAIEHAFGHYRKLGVNVQLLSVQDRPIFIEPGDLITVVLEVTPVVKDPVPHTEIWHFSGVIRLTTQPGVPLGVRPIQRERLVGACRAVEAIRRVPGEFPIEQATCELFWPLVPGVNEPLYTFTASLDTEDLVAVVGAYSGKVHTHPVTPPPNQG